MTTDGLPGIERSERQQRHTARQRRHRLPLQACAADHLQRETLARYDARLDPRSSADERDPRVGHARQQLAGNRDAGIQVTSRAAAGNEQ
jgi:hypothetical protein